MLVLIKVISGLIAPQLPDESTKFQNQEIVTVDEEQYLLADYIGTKNIVSDYDVQAYLAGVEQDAPVDKPVIKLSEPTVTGEGVSLGAGGIWWVKQNTQFTLVASAPLPDSEMMIVVERVINGSTVVDDIRVKARIVDGLITMDAKFEQSGNYQITDERLNKGLDIIGAPFNLSFKKVEFDAYVA